MTTTRLALVALLSTSSLAVLGGCQVRPSNADAPKTVAEPAVSVRTATIATRALPRTLALTGTLTAQRESGVAADVVGKVSQVYVERGSRVKAGAPLVRLDRRAATLAEAEARAQAAAAQSQNALATSECQRATKLFADGAINTAERDRISAQCQATTHAAAAAEARRDLAAKTLQDLVVKAPFSGLVADRFVNEGEYVRPDSRVAAVVQIDSLRLELAVPEHAIAQLSVGSKVRFRVAAYPQDTFEGVVRFVGAQVRRQSRDLLVEALVSNKNEKLRPGMFAVADLVLGETVTPVVPRAALRSDERAGTDRLFVVTDGRIEERLVQVGPASGDEFAVLNGVRAGERVVVAPAPTLRDGLRVQ